MKEGVLSGVVALVLSLRLAARGDGKRNKDRRDRDK